MLIESSSKPIKFLLFFGVKVHYHVQPLPTAARIIATVLEKLWRHPYGYPDCAAALLLFSYEILDSAMPRTVRRRVPHVPP